MYIKKWVSAEKIGAAFKPIYILLSRKYFMDELYENVIVKTVLYNGIFKWMAMFDSSIVDGAVNGAAQGTAGVGTAVRKLQTGQTQLYVFNHCHRRSRHPGLCIFILEVNGFESKFVKLGHLPAGHRFDRHRPVAQSQPEDR